MNFEAIYQEAVRAGYAAGKAAKPVPMNVVSHSNPLDDSSPVEKVWHVPEGVCGFAWVVIKGNSAFGRWAKKAKVARPGYPSGLHFWISEYNQSMERKEAHARAMAQVFEKHGITAYAQSRMD